MIFTSRTYRHAIRRSIQAERDLRIELLRTDLELPEWTEAYKNLLHQINHTRRLQARKRKERK